MLLGSQATPAINRSNDGPVIKITTARSTLTLWVAPDQRLYELGYGAAGRPVSTPEKAPAREMEFYPPSGNGFILEPALQVTHSDGNTSTDLIFVKHTKTALDKNVELTRIELRDGFYPFFVTLCFKAYQSQDVIEQWTEIRNDESRPVTLYRFASSGLLMPKADQYWLTQLHGDWADEAQLVEERLTSGIKVLDSKIGVRALQFRTPSFLISLDHLAEEEKGQVLGGSLEWSGSFQFAFEEDVKNRLRAGRDQSFRLAIPRGP